PDPTPTPTPGEQPAIATPAPEPVPVAPQPLPSEPEGPGEVVQQVLSAAADQVRRAVKPEAALAVTTEFTFPLALALAVLAYLVVQGRVDYRDPKLRIAPQHVTETIVKFQEEDQL
ncbi:MAG: hypothetical protein ACRDHD_10600, partial [Candidatus Limnocylindria bacterium]